MTHIARRLLLCAVVMLSAPVHAQAPEGASANAPASSPASPPATTPASPPAIESAAPPAAQSALATNDNPAQEKAVPAPANPPAAQAPAPAAVQQPAAQAPAPPFTPHNPPTADDICRAVEQDAAENGLPVEFFARVIWQESRFNAFAVSNKGAQGIAQFMPRTADARG